LSGAAATHAEEHILANFFTDLQSRQKRPELVKKLEDAIASEFKNISSSFCGSTEEILFKVGVWIDIPKPPKFEDVDELVVRKKNSSTGVPLKKVFPIREWTDAYQHYRYPVRIFSFSEYIEQTNIAAENAMKKIIQIEGQDFYKGIRRIRD
jgi:hypothetical protein